MAPLSPRAKALVHKLNHRPEFELYNLKKNPYELKNEIENPEYKNVAESMKNRPLAKLAEWRDSDPIATEKSLVKRKNGNDSTSKDKKKYKLSLPFLHPVRKI